MTANPVLPVQTGLVGATPIIAQFNSATLASKVFVTLSSNYARNAPQSYPRPDAGAATATSLLASPQTILSGTRLQLYSDEASALVTGGFASFS
jgi:hypothetical protein